MRHFRRYFLLLQIFLRGIWKSDVFEEKKDTLKRLGNIVIYSLGILAQNRI